MSEVFTDRCIEGASDDFAIEFFDLNLYFVGNAHQIDRVLLLVVNSSFFADPPNDSFGREFRFDLDGRLVVDKVPIDNGFSIPVSEDRLTKYLGSV